VPSFFILSALVTTALVHFFRPLEFVHEVKWLQVELLARGPAPYEEIRRRSMTFEQSCHSHLGFVLEVFKLSCYESRSLDNDTSESH